VLARWTAVVLRFRIAVVVCWAVVLGVGVWSSARLPDLVSTTFAVPGTESDEVDRILADAFDERPEGTFTVVFLTRRADDPRLAARLVRAARTIPGARAGTIRDGQGIAYADIATPLTLQQAKARTEELRSALREPGGAPVHVTGQPAIQHDLDPILGGDLRRGEAVALPIAFVVLVAVLGLSFAVAIPFLFAACTITGTLALVYALAHGLDMVSYVTNLVELIGLALAIDYSLLIVHRFREESARGVETDEAIVRTMETAGRAVVFSGTAVAIGLGLLVLMPLPLIRSLGVGGLLIPLVSIAGAVTLQPALLSLFGRRGLRTAGFHGVLGGAEPAGGFWARLAGTIVRRRVAVLVGVSAALVAVALPALGLSLTPGSISALPGGSDSIAGFRALSTHVGNGAVTPIHIVADGGLPGAARTPGMTQAVDRLADRLVADPEVYVVAIGRRSPYVDATGRYARTVVLARHEYGDRSVRRLVDRIRDRDVPAARFPAGAGVFTGGAPAQGVDFLTRAYDLFPWLVAGALALTYLILLLAFRSLLLPLEAVLLNLLTVGAVYGLLALVFEGPVEGWVPIVLFATLFGISMDYEVFLVSRMREGWDAFRDNERAIVHGLERTGRVVTAAAAIMVAAFSGFLAGRVEGLRQLGLGLVLAILIDATVVRALLLPAAMAVGGRWNWWLPGRGQVSDRRG
jgi:putative drug exporter of the RND superfamily